MRISESRIRQIIREEAKKALQEMPYADSFEPRDTPDPDALSAAGDQYTVGLPH